MSFAAVQTPERNYGHDEDYAGEDDYDGVGDFDLDGGRWWISIPSLSLEFELS